MQAEELEEWLINHIAQELEMSPDQIDPTKPLANYGLDSVTAVSTSGELESLLNITLDPTLLFEYPTIEKIVSYLVGLKTEERSVEGYKRE